MPIVCYYDKEHDKYIIVDGFHRYRVILEHEDIYEREKGMLPVICHSRSPWTNGWPVQSVITEPAVPIT